MGVGRLGAICLVLLACMAPAQATVTVAIAPYINAVSATSSDSYVSFNFDWHTASEGASWVNASVLNIDFENPRLRALARAMAPAYLRIGGSEGDLASYLVNTQAPPSDCAAMPEFCLTMPRWRQLIEFCQDTGLRLVFGLNICAGRNNTGALPCQDPNAPWNGTNTFELLQYTAQNNLTVAGFELGNEKQGVLSPQLAADAFIQTRAWINQLWPNATTRPKLVGPDLNPRADWLRAFLTAAGPGTLDAVTYHLYIGYGVSPDLLQQLTAASTFGFIGRVAGPIQRSQLATASTAELWVGETAAAWHSGQSGTCNAFISGFWYLNQLGMLASTGHKAHCRQALVGGNYALVNQTNNFTPNPDYYTGLLYHRLMGSQYIDVPQQEPQSADLQADFRSYGACTAGTHNGSITIAYVNSFNETVDLLLRIQRLDGLPDNLGNTFSAYFLTSPNLQSLTVDLNGVTLHMLDETTLPNLSGHQQPVGSSITIPALSYGFLVFPDAKAAACS
ncbi:uncharacterized protein MONBRDRAFT_26729 [Monosiga brevicollis MX1]|uniref:Beta-glucuronidase C-terminal domain-containing protein n=1 Tax=Monosiga brevicollis TaxID=81824 RepID=A9V372_MONBE|nr:uncharacterized protein MONBRDRAFT_26729 [Monosiga brevicollis MX1]EDQ88010.1 predicted protein [Monosiga brevicollis MX1]|eukprot:XP_001747086.1 hypothetical protein [Monosiga brevicollis MX1]